MRIFRTGARCIGAPADRFERDRLSVTHNLLAGLCLAALLSAPAWADSARDGASGTAACSAAPSGPTQPPPRPSVGTACFSTPHDVHAAVTAPALPKAKALEDAIVELPRVDDLLPSQDLTAFMQPWVPWALRAAAMRRMWLIDPAIRDFVNPARDYAHDYNVPGGAPGYAPMQPSAEMIRDVHAMLDRRIEVERIEPINASAQAFWPRLWAWW